MQDLDATVTAAIQSTERYYREQIFSSGCSSIVSIYRITENAISVDSIKKQLDGSPYIQQGVRFSERLAEAMLDVQLYVYEGKHFFLRDDLKGEARGFIESCQRVESFDEIIGSTHEVQVDWNELDGSLTQLTSQRPILTRMDLRSIIGQIRELGSHIVLDRGVSNYLRLFQQGEWLEKKEIDYTALLCMVELGKQMRMADGDLVDLVAVGLLKDIGYTRLHRKIDNFELLHPLVSHKIVSVASQADPDCKAGCMAQQVIDAIALHHEFADGSGALTRMGHPLTLAIRQGGKLPLIAQVSGICDLYACLLGEYGSACAYAICMGLLGGLGDVAPRYEQTVLNGFAELFRDRSYQDGKDDPDAPERILDRVVSLIRDQDIRGKARRMVETRSASALDRITLALNLVRNLAAKDTGQLQPGDIARALKLPQEFTSLTA
jgi:hypothetical protein